MAPSYERRDFRRRTAVDRNRSATSACRSSTSVFARICRFYDHRLKVTEATLIPRPETEELVEWCLDETPGVPLEVIDIGTGTGAIAISLKAARKNWHISAVDLSEEALEVAKENAQKEGTKISFIMEIH